MKILSRKMMNRVMPFAAVLNCLNLPVQLSATEASVGSKVVAKVGEKTVSLEDLTPVFSQLDEEQLASLASDQAALSQVVRNLLVQRVLFREAVQAGHDRDPDLATQLEQVRQAAIAESYLKKLSSVPESYPSEEELRAAFEANKSGLLVPKQVELAQIFIAVPEGASEEVEQAARARIDSLRKTLGKPGADFFALAKAESDAAQAKETGGRLGWQAEPLLQAPVREALAKLKPGDVSAPIRLTDGWHILRLLEVKEAYLPELEEIREPLIRRMRGELQKTLSEGVVSEILRKNPIQLNELELSKLLVPAEKSDR